MVEPPSFCFCYFFEDLALLVQIFCFVKVPFLFLILIETWVGELFAVQPGKHNFWNIPKHLRVCGEIKLTWCSPKLGEGVLEEIQIPDLQAPPHILDFSFPIPKTKESPIKHFWWEAKCLVSCFRISWRFPPCACSLPGNLICTPSSHAVGSEPEPVTGWSGRASDRGEIPSWSDLLGFQGLYLELWGFPTRSLWTIHRTSLSWYA